MLAIKAVSAAFMYPCHRSIDDRTDEKRDFGSCHLKRFFWAFAPDPLQNRHFPIGSSRYSDTQLTNFQH